MKSIFAGLILILFGFNSVTFSQSSLPKCEGIDSFRWSKCFGTERVEDKIAPDAEREYVGLGIEVEMEAGVIKVISPIDDTPASRAGIKAGDYIVRIDGDQIQGKTLMEAVNLMRGSVGTPIKIVITRKGEKKAIELKIVRETIQTTFKKAKYVGEYKNGKFHGQGTYTGADGRRYVGEWNDDKFHGRGTFNYPDGRVEEGIWKYGRLVE